MTAAPPSLLVEQTPDAAALAGIPSLLNHYVETGELAGAVTLVARRGKILQFDALGLADMAAGLPMKKDALFWVASMTKPITSAAVLLLVDEGKLALSDPLEKFLPEFKNPWMVAEKTGEHMALKRPSRPVTIRDLLTHTHGLEEPPQPAPGTPFAESVASSARGPLQFEPGSQWKYGNAGMGALGRIIEVVSDRSFPDFLQERFFDPLGMKQSTFYPDADQMKNLAKSYQRPPQWGPLVEVGYLALNGDVAKKEQTVLPGGGLFSTTEDMFLFYQMLLNGGEFDGRRYLAEATVKEMRTSQTGDLEAGFSPGMCWGLGVGIVKNPQNWTDMLPAGTWGHDGVYGTSVMILPEEELLLIMMIQRRTPYGVKFRHAFHGAVMRALAP